MQQRMQRSLQWNAIAQTQQPARNPPNKRAGVLRKVRRQTGGRRRIQPPQGPRRTDLTVRQLLRISVCTHPGKPGKYWNFIIIIPGLEYIGILSKDMENTGT